jgi:phospholipid/cholesterol/gamma-HCH transport system substrate-binding protein
MTRHGTAPGGTRPRWPHPLSWPRLPSWRRLSGAVSAVALLGGCGVPGLYGVPLPGGPDTGEHPYHVTAYFHDVLDLVPQASVKVNDVGVGKVQRIEATTAGGGYAAKVTMLVNADAVLPGNAEAAVRQTSLLGEKFVELRPPSQEQPQGRLTDGAEIPVDRTRRNIEVEELLGAMSMLLGGGGIDRVQSIVHELDAALGGNEPQLRALLTDLDAFLAGLDAQRGEITRALEGLNALSTTLDGQHDQLVTALDGLEPGLAVLVEQREQLVGMLAALDRLGGVAADVVNRSRDDLLADLRALQPVLTGLASAGANLPKSLEVLFTFPFPDNAVDAIRGDYANLDVLLDLDLREVLGNLGGSAQPVPLPGLPAAPLLPLPGLPALPVLPAVPGSPGQPGGQDPSGQPGGSILDGLIGLFGGGQP